MFELCQAGESTYYIESPAKIGVYLAPDGGAWFIDSGSDKDAGRKLNQVCKAQNWTLRCILNTHSNADHTGGNAFLQSRTGCEIWSKGMERPVVEYPLLEPSFLYGGYPPKALRNKFLMAQPSAVKEMRELPEGLETIPLPGHFFEMLGFRTKDGVVFLADALSGAHIVEKYHVNFLYDVAAYLDTLDRIEEMEAKLFIPSHGEPTEDIRPLVEVNRNKVHEIIDLLLNICREPHTAEGIQKAVFDHYGLTMNFNQYVLVGSTLRSYLAHLLDAGRVEALFEENRLLWKTVAQ